MRHAGITCAAAAAAAAVLLSTVTTGVARADQSPVALPPITTSLTAGQPCTGASGQQAQAQPWTVGALSLAPSWSLTRGAGVTVGVVDTGVGTDIPALAGRVTAVGDANQDCVGHGSFVAGLIAAAHVAGSGVVGVAPEVRILAVRGSDERGVPTLDLVADGIRAAVDGGAGVVYVGAALAAGGDRLTAAVDYATAHDVLVVAPAAPDTTPRSGDLSAHPCYPAFIPRVLSVEDFGPDGTRPSNAPNVFAADLAAPGDAVVSTGPTGSGHFIGSGPSLAAANAVGAAALVRAYLPKLTAAQVYQQLVTSGYPGSIPVLDPYAALDTVPGARPAAPSIPTPPAHMPAQAPTAPLTRALLIAAVSGGALVLVAALAVLVPRGRARAWRPADW